MTTMKSVLRMLTAAVLLSVPLFGQGVGISESSITPDGSAILELRSLTRGLLLPRNSAVLGSPVQGLSFYNTTSNRLNLYNGSTWLEVPAATAGNSLMFTTTGATTLTLPTSGTLVNSGVTTLSSLSSIGTITTGTWSASTIAVNRGGTGATTLTSNGVLYGNGTGTVQATTASTAAGQVMQTSTAGGAPAWAKGVTIVTLGADVVNNNATANTLQDVTGFSFGVTAGTTYNFRAQILYTSAATGTGSRWTINGPATTFLAYRSVYTLTATTVTTNNLSAYNLPAASNAGTNPTSGVTIIEGVIQPSASGTVIVRFASEVASSAITAKAGSTLMWW